MVEGLEELSLVIAGIKIASGFRCEARNKEIGGRPHSFHLKGQAVDVLSEFSTPEDIAKNAKLIECFNGLGKYLDHVHLDVRTERIRW